MRINELVCQVQAELQRCNYSVHTQKCFRPYFRAIEKYAEAKGLDEYTVQLGSDFLRDKYNYPFKPEGRLCTTVQNASRTVELMSSFLNTGQLSRRRNRNSKRTVANSYIQHIVDDYIDSIRENHRNDSALRGHRNTVCDLIEHLRLNSFSGISSLSAIDIGSFIVTLKDAVRGTRKIKLYHLRFFLRFLYARQITATDLSLAVPSLRFGTQKRVPEPITVEETDEFLKAIDRHTPHGKRDYAIVQMISQLGMRSIDVRLFKFEHIDWDAGILRYAQSKTRQPIELPMSEEIGLYLIDYLRNGRPNVQSDYVFLRDIAPYEPMRGLSDICRRYLKDSKNCVPKHGQGFHSFRHALASRMLKEGVPLHIIAQILGHINNKTIGEYLRIDFDRLELCAIDPEEVHESE